MVSREVISISPLPNRRAASVMHWLSSAVILPLRVMMRALKQSVPLLCKKPHALTRLMSSALTVTLPSCFGIWLTVRPPSSTLVLV